MLITKKIEIDMGHRIPNHISKCRNLHGHRYVIEIGVNDNLITKAGDSSEGMVMDFGILKQIMMEEIDSIYDHGFCIHVKDSLIDVFIKLQRQGERVIICDFIPTAEELAKHWYCMIKKRLESANIRILHCKVWETPTSTAIFRREDESTNS